jgi:hypothetical protein
MLCSLEIIMLKYFDSSLMIVGLKIGNSTFVLSIIDILFNDVLQPTKNDSSFFSVIKQIGKSRVLCSHA